MDLGHSTLKRPYFHSPAKGTLDNWKKKHQTPNYDKGQNDIRRQKNKFSTITLKNQKGHFALKGLKKL